MQVKNTVEIIKDLDALKGIEDIWGQLHMDNDNGTYIFLSFTWVLNWLKHFSKDKEIFILLVKQDNKVIGIAPFVITKRFFIKRIQFIGTGEANYLDFIFNDAVFFNILNEFFKTQYRNWHLIELLDIPENSDSIRYLRGNLKAKIFSADDCPYIEINKNWQDFFSEGLKKKTRYNLNRQFEKLKVLDGFNCKIFSYDESELSKIDNIYQIYKDLWQNRYNRSSFLEYKNLEFYKDTLKQLFKNRNAAISYLSISDNVFAFSISLIYKNKIIDYLIGYDKDFSIYSPGSVLLSIQLEYAFDHGVKEFDFSKGIEPYKERWANNRRKNQMVLIMGDNLASKIISSLFICFYKIRYGLKRSRFLRAFAVLFLTPLSFSIFMDILKKLARYIKEEGPVVVIKGLLRKITETVFEIKIRYIFIIEDTHPAIKARADCLFEKLKMDIDELKNLAYLRRQTNLKGIFNNLYRENICFVIKSDDKIIACGWVITGKVYSDEIDYALEANEALISDCFVSPDYRRKGIYTFLLQSVVKYLLEKDYKRIFISTLKNNIASLKGIEKSNFRMFEELKLVKFPEIKRYKHIHK